MKHECIRYYSELLCEEYHLYHHPSGLEVYIFPKKLSTTYAIFGTKYGSIHNCFRVGDQEPLTVPDGIAHFLEHKLFANEDGSDSFERFSDYGADANAYTSESKTCYLFSCTDHFEKSLRELLTFVTHPYFTEESVAAERGIISEEIRMYEDNPADRCFYGMLEAMYERHSIRRNICGSVSSIAKITPALLYRCYEAFYRPDNMALVICGRVSDDTVLSICDDCLPSRKKELPAVFCENENKKEAPQAHLPYIEKRMQVAKALFNIGFKDIQIPDSGEERQKKDAAMAILNEMLFSRGGELYNRLLKKDLISPAMSYGYTMTKTAAYNSIAGESDDPEQVLAEIRSYLSEVAEKGLSYDDFIRGKRVMYAEFVKDFDSTDSIANNLFSFLCEDSDLLTYAEHIEAVTFEEVCSLFPVMFAREATVLSVILPLHDPIQN